MIGQDRIGEKKIDQAVLVLKLNVETNPASFRAWISLGKAHALSREKALAIEDFKRSLELNPKNAGARAALASLQGQ